MIRFSVLLLLFLFRDDIADTTALITVMLERDNFGVALETLIVTIHSEIRAIDQDKTQS